MSESVGEVVSGFTVEPTWLCRMLGVVVSVD